jgi:murein DD-endopeptidase MepM/ murein hydrolase activator NlpD
MASFVMSSRARVTSRLAAVAVISAGIAGCSSDIGRFNENPFTGTIGSRTPPAPVAAAPAPRGYPVGRVQSQALPPTQTASLPPPPAQYPVQQSAPIAHRAPIAQRTPMAAPVQAAPSRASGVHVVTSGETLFGIARKYSATRTEIARANGIAPTASVRIGQRLVIPGAGQPVAAAPSNLRAPIVAARPMPPAPAPKQQIVAARPVATTPAHNPAPVAAAPAPQAPQRTAAVQPTEKARLATPAVEAAAEAKSEQPSAAGAATSFRWPVRGRVIAGFGPKPNGQQNDGINLAVPEGTSVKAADDGVVAYAGNELKGYGNLVLVRHGNGYVTAYAHASELKVKRGDPVKRGQIIALAGQTGNVASPQLHFEIRKGSTPIDPTQLMASN